MKPRASCQDDFDPESLGVAEARARIAERLRPVAGTETVALRDALGRVLAEEIRAPLDVPPGTNSAMDGYAVRGADLPAAGERSFRLLGHAYAGHPYTGPVGEGECVRIMTGALVPPDCDTVVIQEHAEELPGENAARLAAGARRGDNVRAGGEDIRQGERIFGPGRRLTAADLGLLASLGLGQTAVRRPLRVAFCSTGDELCSVGETLAPGMLYDSNRYTLYGMLRRPGIEQLDLGVVRDESERLERTFRDAAARADVLITSGGVSVGEADRVREVLARIGQMDFWKVAMKPGRPLAFGRIGEMWLFGLPGNPVSVMVTFHQIVAPALRRLEGEAEAPPPPRFELPCVSRLRKRPGRIEYQRGCLERDQDGRLVVRKTGGQGSGILRSMSLADCYILLPEEAGDIEPGSMVSVQPFPTDF